MALKQFCDRCGKQVEYKRYDSCGQAIMVSGKGLSTNFNVLVNIDGLGINKNWCRECCAEVLPGSVMTDAAKRLDRDNAQQTLAEKLEEIIREIVREEIPES